MTPFTVKTMRVLVSKTIQEREYEPYRVEAETTVQVDAQLNQLQFGGLIKDLHKELDTKIGEILLERWEANKPTRRRRGGE